MTPYMLAKSSSARDQLEISEEEIIPIGLYHNSSFTLTTVLGKNLKSEVYRQEGAVHNLGHFP